MRIGLDIDNILCSTTEALLEYINERLGTTFTISDVQDYWIENLLDDQYKWIVSSAFSDPLMWKNVKFIQEAYGPLSFLYGDGAELYFITATTPDNLRKKVKFLERTLTFLPEGYVQSHFISIKEKQLVHMDYLVDDYIENLINGPYQGICLAYPWNIQYQEQYPEVIYCRNWHEIYTYLFHQLRSNS